MTRADAGRGVHDQAWKETKNACLPVSSSAIESRIKEINDRVKGTEKFWNRPAGAEHILQVRAAALSDDDKLSAWISEPPRFVLPPCFDPETTFASGRRIKTIGLRHPRQLALRGGRRWDETAPSNHRMGGRAPGGGMSSGPHASGPCTFERAGPKPAVACIFA